MAAVVPKLQSAVTNLRPPWWSHRLSRSIWANLHGLWATALVLYGILIVGKLFDLGIRRWQAVLPLVAAGVLCATAACLTPNGPALLLAPAHVRTYAQFVTEWAAPPLLNPFYGCAYLYLAIVLVGWSRRESRIVPGEAVRVRPGGRSSSASRTSANDTQSLQ